MSSGSTKQRVLRELYSMCLERGQLTFSNTDVRQITDAVGFGNAYDATKIDSTRLLPSTFKSDDVFIVHLGGGFHRFIKGIDEGYHGFEAIPEGRQYQWPYRRSLLNAINTSESNILAVAYNQRILHDFLYQDIAASPKMYGSNRTHIDISYIIGSEEITPKRLQVEIDLTLEHLGTISIFEAKNGFPDDFNVFQLYNPFRYYERIAADIERAQVNCCYLLRQKNRLRLYLYTFDRVMEPGSILLERNAEYVLVER